MVADGAVHAIGFCLAVTIVVITVPEFMNSEPPTCSCFAFSRTSSTAAVWPLAMHEWTYRVGKL
jgi:hypothetical protein